MGLVPREEDINLENLDISREDLKKLLSLDNNLWNQELTEVQNFYSKFDKKLPNELIEILENF